MSFRAGHYFSLESIDNSPEYQNNYVAIDYTDFSTKDLVRLWKIHYKMVFMAYVSAFMKMAKTWFYNYSRAGRKAN